MLLDEPTQGMGHEDVARITELIRRVASGRTVLMVEHNMSVVSGLCDRITVLARGSVLAEGSYAEVSANPAVLEAYMGGSDAPLAQTADS
jgi:branched-chain amino acid transport system ATP-binding protein